MVTSDRLKRDSKVLELLNIVHSGEDAKQQICCRHIVILSTPLLKILIKYNTPNLLFDS